MKIIDAHAHLRKNAAGIDEIVDSGVFEQIWLMDLSQVGALNGVEFASQQELLDTVKRYPGFFLAFGFLDLDHAVPDDLDRLVERGFAGLKPYKPLHAYSDAAYFPLYERAEKLHLPILFHTGLIAHGDRYRGNVDHSFGAEHARPVHLTAIAEAFPDLNIIGGHQGWPFMEEMEQNLYYYRNIYSDVSGYMRSVSRLNEIFNRMTHEGSGRYFNEKMFFATDEFYGEANSNARALRLAQFWQNYFEFVGELYYRWGSPAEKEKFFRGNAIALRQSFPNA